MSLCKIIKNQFFLKGPQLCCGQAVDADLLKLIKTEVSDLHDSVTISQQENQDTQVCSKYFKSLSQNKLRLIKYNTFVNNENCIGVTEDMLTETNFVIRSNV